MRVSFLHGGTEQDASYRYRARRPAEALGAGLNAEADVYIFAKPHQDNAADLLALKSRGKYCIVDTCDIHWQRPEIKTMMMEAHALTVNTPYMAQLVQQQFGRETTIIEDPYEYEERPPHCQGNHLLWFGHPSNGDSFNRFAQFIHNFPYEVVTRRKAAEGVEIDQHVKDWSLEGLRESLAVADIVLLPETAPYKSCNRTVEAVRQGCFVVAEPHQSLIGFPGIWIGNIKEGVAWAIQHQTEARAMTAQAQEYIRERYSLAHTVNAWRTLLTACVSTWEPERSIGTAGLTSMPSEVLALPRS
jgi:hypothetical protein